tara:strand:+ start:276 stop:770 length:495 start_codon:yes stop_codon:yes gene_type:complete
MTIIIKNKERLIYDDFFFKCCVGKKGLTNKKKEGDKKSPKGIFNIEDLYYRKDKIKKPNTSLKCIPIKKNMGWCDDMNNKKYYNKLIKIKKNIRHEKLFRKDNKYDLLVPISFNRKRRVIGKGSAIFLHLTNNYNKTEGCIALKKSDFLILLRLIKKKTKIKIT